ETMAVAFVLGNLNQFPSSLFSATATVTVKLANEFTEADKDLHLSALFYLALLLFLMSFSILAVAKYFIFRTKAR
ncbi:MAG: phosphate ABC transporter permease PstC, partial [Caldimicrobium sp.]